MYMHVLVGEHAYMKKEHILTISCAFLSHLNSWHRAFTAAVWFFCTAIISGVPPRYNRMQTVYVHGWWMDIYMTRHTQTHASVIVISHTKRLLNEQGDTSAKSAGVQLIGEGDACVKVLQLCSMLWISVLSAAIFLPHAIHSQTIRVRCSRCVCSSLPSCSSVQHAVASCSSSESSLDSHLQSSITEYAEYPSGSAGSSCWCAESMCNCSNHLHRMRTYIEEFRMKSNHWPHFTCWCSLLGNYYNIHQLGIG